MAKHNHNPFSLFYFSIHPKPPKTKTTNEKPKSRKTKIPRSPQQSAFQKLLNSKICPSPGSPNLRSGSHVLPPSFAGVVDELEEIFGLGRVEWLSGLERARLLEEKVDRVLKGVLYKMGYRVFSYYGQNGRWFLVIGVTDGRIFFSAAGVVEDSVFGACRVS
ncbi:hypothetical protein AWENTII_008061 [Aspergillus wentii]